MSNFLPLVKKTYEFEGDIINVEFVRFTRQQMMKITPLLPKVASRDGKGAPLMEEQSIEQQSEMVNFTVDVLNSNVKAFTGLKTVDGDALDLADIIDDSYFTELLSTIASDLMTESMVKEKKPKKQKGQSTK